MRLLRSLFLIAVTLLALNVWAQRPSGVRPPVSSPPGYLPPAVSRPDQPTHSNHADDEGRVEFRSETILIQVPVVVTDKAGHHVHNLKKEDFEIFENGKEQKLATLEEVNSTQTLLAPATKPGIFTNVVPDRDKPRSLTVIALDTVNTPFLDQSYARQELIKYLAKNIDTQQPLALVLITSKGLKVVHGLGSSPAALQEALNKASGEMPVMQTVDSDVQLAAFTGDTSNLFGPNSVIQAQSAISNFITQGDIDYAQFRQEAAIETTMQAFLGIAWSLTGVPGRKTLLWTTAGFPFAMDSPSAIPGGRLSLLYERAMQALNEAEISVYPVDVRGLLNYSPEASPANRVRAGAAALQQNSSRAWLVNTTQDTLKDFAEMTGGKAYYNTNDLVGAFQRASDDGASYYMLAYYLDTKNDKAGWRQLKVKTKQKDWELRARKGFFVTNATMNPEVTRTNDINFAIGAPFEATGMPFEMRWGPAKESPGTTKKQVQFSLHVLGSDIMIAGERNSIDLAIVAVATKPEAPKDSEAKIAGNLSQDVKGNLAQDKVPVVRTHGVTVSNVLSLDPGKYNVRFVVRDNLSGRLGSVSTPLTVN